jgi:hypothetical protein
MHSCLDEWRILASQFPELTQQAAAHPVRLPTPTPEQAPPESPPPPPKLMSYAIQAHPGLAWREITLMTALFVRALYQLIDKLVA